MMFNKAAHTKDAYSFQLIHDVKNHRHLEVDDIAETIAKMTFHEMSVIIPPYMYDILFRISIRNTYDSSDDALILHIIDEWLEAHKDVIGEWDYD